MEVKVNQEIRDYKERIIFGLTYKQLFWIIFGLVLSVLAFSKIRKAFGVDVAGWTVMLIMTVCVLISSKKYNGMSAGRFVICWIRATFLMPKRLHFVSNNAYKIILNEIEKSSESKSTGKNKKNKNEKESVKDNEDNSNNEEAG